MSEFTSSKAVGEVVPIPTLPADVTRRRSVDVTAPLAVVKILAAPGELVDVGPASARMAKVPQLR